MFARGEGNTVNKVVGPVAGGFEPGEKRLTTCKAQVGQTHIGLDRHAFDLKAQDVSQRTVRVGEAVKEIPVLIVGCAADDLTAAQQHIHFQHRFVRQAEAKRRRFDANAAHRPSDGDRFQLWYDGRHQSVCECSVSQCFVSHHAFGFNNALCRVHREHVLKVTDIKRVALDLAIPKQVGCRFAEADVSPRSATQVLGEALLALLVTHSG